MPNVSTQASQVSETTFDSRYSRSRSGVVGQAVQGTLPLVLTSVGAKLDPHRPVSQLQRAWRVDEPDSVVDDDGHAVAELVGHHHVVGREKDRGAPLLAVADQIANLAAR